jgi:hypothetical protein
MVPGVHQRGQQKPQYYLLLDHKTSYTSTLISRICIFTVGKIPLRNKNNIIKKVPSCFKKGQPRKKNYTYSVFYTPKMQKFSNLFTSKNVALVSGD